ncbi:hypothetical protein OG836_04300 [Micromonospora zamorensis]
MRGGPGEEAAYPVALVDAVGGVPGVELGLGERGRFDAVVV